MQKNDEYYFLILVESGQVW